MVEPEPELELPIFTKKMNKEEFETVEPEPEKVEEAPIFETVEPEPEKVEEAPIFETVEPEPEKVEEAPIFETVEPEPELPNDVSNMPKPEDMELPQDAIDDLSKLFTD